MNIGETIYLDNAATTYPKPEIVYERMNYVNRNLAINAGRGSYALAKQANQIIDETKEYLLGLVCANQVAEVVLSASATIALNQVIGGLPWKKEDMVYVSPYEHNAVMRTLHMQQKKYGFQIEELPIAGDTLEIDLAKIDYIFAQRPPAYVFMSHISNVTGYILPIREVTIKAKEYQAKVLIDASQSLGLLELDMRTCEADIVVFAGHKNLYGPFGIGGFYIRTGMKLDTYLAGGTGSDSLNLEMPSDSPGRYEPASPNIVAIAGLHAALDVLRNGEEQVVYQRHEKEMSDLLTKELQNISDVKVYNQLTDNYIGIVPFNINGYLSSDVGMLLDEDYGIAVRTGYHCAPLIHKYLKDEGQLGVVRASVGRYTTEEDVWKLVNAVKELVEV